MRYTVVGALALGLALSASHAAGAQRTTPRARPPAAPVSTAPAAAADAAASSLPMAGAEKQFFQDAARTAWTYVDRQTNASSGLVNSVANYHFTTMWDIGSGLLALYSAGQLGLVPAADYDRRMRLALHTLATTRMYDNAAFNKNYDTRTGAMAGRNGTESEGADRGYGWSALDLGRLLVALKVIDANQPQYHADVQQVVGRLAFDRLVRDGYLSGEDVAPRSRRARRYQEGKIGYEQYSAMGYAAWQHRPDRALSLAENTYPITVLGVPLLMDKRGGKLTSEPFLMAGLEMGWTPEMRELSWRLLAAQEARFRQTGKVTLVSEDALNRPPYFLYYSVYSDGEAFKVEPPEGAPPGDTPRTVSTKAAFGWHALLPSPYTWRALQMVSGARTSEGWGAGVFEDNGRISGATNVNTAAMVLEASLYVMRGKPLVEPASAPPLATAPAAGAQH
ncbi:MAG: Tfp pilus assembly protein FimV [Gemmatimonadetes bacterium]|nr:Tfp pilus assembly protein FimV [Gemmatimonadota bacterium]